MNNVYIYGDSHALKMSALIFNNFLKKTGVSEKEYSIVNVKNTKSFVHKIENNEKKYITTHSDMVSLEYNNSSLSILSTPGRSALNYNYDSHDILKKFNKDNSIVMPWLGYIDIKNWIPDKTLKNYKDAKEVVEIYFENTVKRFPNSKIIFINPVPQFEIIIAQASFKSDKAIDFEKRHESHLEFTEILKNKCIDNGLEIPMDIANILNIEWVTTDMQYNKSIKHLYNDHLRSEFYDIILDSIIDKTKLWN